jgi:hypothetical protein
MCTKHLHHIYPPSPFPYLLPSHQYQPPQSGPVLPPILWFCIKKKWKNKNMTFLLHSEFPRDISIYICIITWTGSSPKFFSFLPGSPFYDDLKILYSYLYRKYINCIHLLNFLLLLSPFHMWPP